MERNPEKPLAVELRNQMKPFDTDKGWPNMKSKRNQGLSQSLKEHKLSKQESVLALSMPGPFGSQASRRLQSSRCDRMDE